MYKKGSFLKNILKKWRQYKMVGKLKANEVGAAIGNAHTCGRGTQVTLYTRVNLVIGGIYFFLSQGKMFKITILERTYRGKYQIKLELVVTQVTEPELA